MVIKLYINLKDIFVDIFIKSYHILLIKIEEFPILSQNVLWWPMKEIGFMLYANYF